MYNVQVAKVYHQGGEICSSTKYIPPGVSPRTVELEIENAKRMLAARIAAQVLHRLDEASMGEI